MDFFPALTAIALTAALILSLVASAAAKRGDRDDLPERRQGGGGHGTIEQPQDNDHDS